MPEYPDSARELPFLIKNPHKKTARFFILVPWMKKQAVLLFQIQTESFKALQRAPNIFCVRKKLSAAR